MLIPHSPERDEWIRQRVHDGVSIRAIADEIGVKTTQAVRYHLKRLGLHPLSVRIELAAGRAEAPLVSKPGPKPEDDDSALLAIYERCMAGERNWLNVQERSREERVGLILKSLYAELAAHPLRKRLQHAIALWEKPQPSAGPQSVECRQWRVAG